MSVAAIDALLEIPARVDGVQGRFQAFEISVTTETPLPVVPLPVGARINVPFESANEKTAPVTDPNPHAAWIPSEFAGAVAPFTLPSLDFKSTDVLAAAVPAAEDSLSLGELTNEAIDAAFGELSSDATDNALTSGSLLDLATATLLAVLIGRALWPARASKDDGSEKTERSQEASVRPLRLTLDRMVHGG